MILFSAHPVLDKGFVRVVDVMGTDSSVVQAARISYGKGTKSINDDTNLIRYLLKHKHTTPFEMCEIKLHVKAPIFVARQWIRHRTANVNEYSARYSEMSEDFYFPSHACLQKQSQTNKQGRDAPISLEEFQHIVSQMHEVCESSFKAYKSMLDAGIAREIARIILPVNLYTEFYWKIDAHNLMHFLKLRSSANAQYEIRQYANVILHIFAEWMPITYQAFVDYSQYSTTLSRQEVHILQKAIDRDTLIQQLDANPSMSNREKNHLKSTLLG